MSNPLSERSTNRAIHRRRWLTLTTNLAVGSLLVSRSSAQQKLLPLQSSGLDHLSLTVPDSLQAARFYGRIFDPQVFHERTGVQRYYVRLGAAYMAFGPQANVAPYIDHIAAGVIGFVEADSAMSRPERRSQPPVLRHPLACFRCCLIPITSGYSLSIQPMACSTPSCPAGASLGSLRR